MDMSVTIAGLRLQTPIMNAAGTCKIMDGAEGLLTLLRSEEVGAIMIGSATVEPRLGNSGTPYYSNRVFSLNSIGLANPGIKAYRSMLPEMIKRTHDAGKPLFFNVVGFSPVEYAELAYAAFEEGVDLVELNLGCPNVWECTQQKGIPSFDPVMVSSILDQVKDAVGDNARIAVKLSPFTDPYAFQNILITIAGYQVVKVLTLCNTLPNAYACDENGKQRISHLNGLAGLAGAYMKPVALGQIIQAKQIPKCERLQIVGSGGVLCGQDLKDYLSVGAWCVQVGTAYVDRGPRVFAEILAEYVEE